MIPEGVAVLVLGAAVIMAALATMPRCPECGYLRTAPDGIDPGLRHCRRCQAVFQPGGRR